MDSFFPNPSISHSGALFAVTEAQQAQSHERRFSRALYLTTIPRTAIYQALLRQALSGWGDASITLALDTTRLFQRWCLVCVSLTYRGRAIPLAWQLLEHNSSTVAFEDIYPVLVSVRSLLSHLPNVEQVYIGADRGFMDRQLMSLLSAYGWKWNIRGKAKLRVFDAQGSALGQFHQQLSQRSGPVFLNNVYITKNHYGPVNLAAYNPPGAREPWFIISSEPCHPQTFAEYGERFQIEEGFLDLKSGGFDLEASHIRDTTALQGLIFLLALGAVFLYSEGTSLVDTGKRQSVDPHSHRRLSYFQLGRRAIQTALTHRFPLLTRLFISPFPDPEPLRKRQTTSLGTSTGAFS